MTYHFGNLLTRQTQISSQIFYFALKMQNLLGVQNAGYEGAAKILDFDLYSQKRPPLKLNSKNILCYAIF